MGLIPRRRNLKGNLSKRKGAVTDTLIPLREKAQFLEAKIEEVKVRICRRLFAEEFSRD